MQKITVQGKDYDLDLTVGAFAEISDLCPGGDFSRIGELQQEPLGKVMITTAKIIAVMSRGAEERKRFENPEYDPKPLTFEAIRNLPFEEYLKLHPNIGALLSPELGDKSIKTESSKKKENPAGK